MHTHISLISCLFIVLTIACLFSSPQWLEENGDESARWTYGELYERSRVVGAHLTMRYNLKKGDRVLLVYEPCVEFLAAFWACAGNGIIAVPVCPPDPFSPKSDPTDKLLSIWTDAQPKVILTSRRYKDTLAAARTFLGPEFDNIMNEKEHILDLAKRLWITTDDLTYISNSAYTFPTAEQLNTTEDDILLLQYTSGSTGGAKGVMVQHKTAIANCLNCVLLTQGLGSLHTYQYSLGVSWLPTFHDMGLFGMVVAPMLVGGSMVYFSPIHFIQNPILWLQAVSRYKHVSTGVPPFALDLCTRRVTQAELDKLDLSGLEICILGAEPIRASYMEDFTRKFSPCGFNAKAFMPCYGMAENVLHVAGKWSNQYEGRKILVDSHKLNRNQLSVFADQIIGDGRDTSYYSNTSHLLETESYHDKDCQWLVSSGELVSFTHSVTIEKELHNNLRLRKPHFYRREIASFVAIVNPDTLEECADGTVGEIWICGPSRTSGYWQKPEVNKQNFQAVLKKAVKKDTQSLLQWGQKTSREQPTRIHEYAQFSSEVITSTQHPLINLARSSVAHNGDVHWLRSGDMGVVFDGNLFITGRIKDMIIIRGQNYYADDIEHCVTAGKAIGDVAEGVSRSLTQDPTISALACLRPGSAIAYSITVTSDGTDSCPARVARVEGEHLCVMVELQNEVDDDTDGDDDGYDDVNDLDDTSATDKSAKKKQKHGNQAPLWQRVLMRYGGSLIHGMSKAYESNEQDLIQSLTNKDARHKKLGCNERVKVAFQRAFINSVRMSIGATRTVLGYFKPLHVIQAELKAQADADLAARTHGHTNTLTERSKHLPADADTLKTRAKYTDSQLNTIASAIRRAISVKFMLVVGEIVFLTPRSVKKTSSGKKRRHDMTHAVEEGYMDHRIVKRCYSKNLDQYYALKLQRQGGSTVNITKHKLGNTNQHNHNHNHHHHHDQNESVITSQSHKHKSHQSSSSSSSSSSDAQFGGTVGVSLSGPNNAYSVGPRQHNTNLVQAHKQNNITSTHYAHHNTEFKPIELLPARVRTSDVVNKDEALLIVKNLQQRAHELTFDIAKQRILHVIVDELNAFQAQPTFEAGSAEQAEYEANRGFTHAQDSRKQGSELMTIEYLREMATKSAEEQQAKLDEYGLDSMTGFKLSKSLASEFDLPSSMMGPHLFLQDPTIDGMVRVMVQLVQLQASKAVEEFKKEYETPKQQPQQVKIAQQQLDTAAFVYRGTTDPQRIPYVLAIGTAVPFSCAPQQEVIQAMLPPMQMDKKSEDRFMKIGVNSGVGTRYSAVNNLGDLFWGKEGVNSGNDEFVDARQEIYKKESVRLSIQSSADCLHDWMSQKRIKNDDERDTERLTRFLEVERAHREYEEKKLQQEKSEKQEKPQKEGKKSKKNNSSSSSASSTSTSSSSSIPSSEQEQKESDVDLSHLAKLAQDKLGRTITHVVAVTCTGIIVPGLEFHIMQALGLPLTTQRLSIQFMGCFGAVSGLRCASSLAAENPNNRVLVVCTELCTLHMQLNDKVDNLIATALFADGSGAFIVGCNPTPAERPLFAVHACSSFIIPNTLDQMAWEMTKTGLHIGLAKEIAGEIFNHIGDFVEDMLKYSPDPNAPQHRVSAKDCNCAIHPGGPLIINTIQNVLGIDQVGDGHGGGDIDSDAPTAESWKILKEYGNMSSATLVFVLDRIRENKKRKDKWTPTVAFGPGLSIEGCLLKACFPEVNDDGTY